MVDQVVHLFEPGRPQPRLAEKDVTIARLREALELAVFSTELDDEGDIYVKDGADFPFWIFIDDSSKMIRLFTYWSQPTTSVDEVNNANAMFKAVQFCLHDNRVIANYYMSYHAGLDTRQLIVMIRHFGSICRKALDKLKSHERELDANE